MAVSTRTKRSAARPLIVTLIVIVVIAALGFCYASPYMALNTLKRAADARDAQTVNEYVDFPALRESLKQQVTGLLTRRLDGQGNGNPLAAIGAMIGVALIGPLVDAYATPDGVAALLNGMPPRGNPGERPPVPAGAGNPPAAPAAAPEPAPPAAGNNGNSATPPQPPQTTAGYRGLNEFVVSYQHGAGDARYSAILRREGLFTWKLAAVNLNE
ncbi:MULTISPECIES: DUF2939 domain-containing protein [Paraburkholderia]|jgi:hypothetical protein|uniref:DUF2939 domain-containing protein n=1 Tax=Paraburkholderia TaxID=1822464 RepID=UPI001B2CBB1A|nr:MULTISPECIES: DUF2939 domain-containing protein [Paraburkholderia]MCX4154242.1 DUF2939 domain-containing protein [Paraburkholderia aspalathi]MDN7163658.1 DUF2939 domain-containing protein [Paraburkholderia sp. SECH2]MDQ6392143.1 DUF2939 domain-containing protein [Paraburkholderia aspalathi]CAE6762940.1 hypothetical protein R20943_03481 [Paraburkholderia aspalathi]